MNFSEILGAAANPIGAATAYGADSFLSSGEGAYQGSIDSQAAADDERLNKGLEEGRRRGEEIYGQNSEDTSSNVQDIVKRRRERLDGTDPTASRLRDSRNRQLRMAKASGASPEELSQISRNSETDIAQQDFQRSGESLNDYQKLVGNILKGQTGLELGYGNLSKAGEQVEMPESKGLMGSVICTEMHRQGYMSDEIFEMDKAYGAKVRSSNPDIYTGYYFLASPVVSLMRKSKTFTYIISKPAMAWAYNMAGEKNAAGALISFFGEKICGFVGGCLNGIQSTKVTT